MNTGDGLSIVNFGDKFYRASHATEQSVEENQRRKSLVLYSTAKSHGFSFCNGIRC